MPGTNDTILKVAQVNINRDIFPEEYIRRVMEMLSHKICDVKNKKWTPDNGLQEFIPAISNSYVEKNFMKKIYDVVYIYESGQDKGFALCFYDENGLYIDVICSAGFGGKLLDYIIQDTVAQKLNLTLSSLPYVLAFYWKKGFRFTRSCSRAENSQITPELINQVALEAKTDLAYTIDLAFNNEKAEGTRKLLSIIQREHLSNNNKVCKNNKPPLSLRQAYAKSCGQNGYNMIRCTFADSELNPILIKVREQLKSIADSKKKKTRIHRLTEAERLEQEAPAEESRKRSESTSRSRLRVRASPEQERSRTRLHKNVRVLVKR